MRLLGPKLTLGETGPNLWLAPQNLSQIDLPKTWDEGSIKVESLKSQWKVSNWLGFIFQKQYRMVPDEKGKLRLNLPRSDCSHPPSLEKQIQDNLESTTILSIFENLEIM